jgi:hypothetical protein
VIVAKVTPLCFISTAEAFVPPKATEVSGVIPLDVATNGPITTVAAVLNLNTWAIIIPPY